MPHNKIFLQPLRLNTAVLFLVFNRLDLTVQVFEAIRIAKPPRLYISSDGPRNNKEGEFNEVIRIREYLLQNIDWECEVKTLFRESNLGCRLAVSSAIDWFFKHEEQGIILEDDCLPSQSFFWYCEEMLEKYQFDKKISMISGYTIDHDNNSKFSYRFSKLVNIWGWATWRRAWCHYNINLNYEEVNDDKHYLYFLKYSNKIKDLFIQFLDKNVDTWDMQWIFTCLSKFQFGIIPEKSLIQNIGFDQRGTHTKTSVTRFTQIRAMDLIFPLKHPNIISSDEIQKRDIKYIKYHHSFNYFSSFYYLVIKLLSRGYHIFKKRDNNR
jgi:hypothetical protein